MSQYLAKFIETIKSFVKCVIIFDKKKTHNYSINDLMDQCLKYIINDQGFVRLRLVAWQTTNCTRHFCDTR